MSISAASILVDGTVATTGGTATSFKTKGGTLDRLDTFLDDASEFVNQTKVTFTVKDPKVSTSAPNGYTQHRNTIKLSKPLLLDNGNYTVNTLTITLSVDHEATAAEVQNLLVSGAQLLHDSDFSDFWKEQSLA